MTTEDTTTGTGFLTDYRPPQKLTMAVQTTSNGDESTASGRLVPGPEALLRGRFALYITPDDAVVISYRPDGAPADKQLILPPMIVASAAAMAGGTVEDLIGKLREAVG